MSDPSPQTRELEAALDALRRENARLQEMATGHERARQAVGAALDDSEERYRVLFERMAQGVVYQDSQGQITRANPAAERILGLTLAQMQGRQSIDARWRAIREDGSDFPGAEHPAMVALRTGREVRGVLMGIFNPAQNEYRWLEVNSVPAFRPDASTPHEVFTTFEDMTERMRADRELREVQKSEAVAQLAGGIAHDFNNILTTLLMNVGLLAEEPGLTPAARAGLQDIRDEANRAANLTRQLLQFSRRSVLQRRLLDLNEQIGRQMPVLEKLLGEQIKVTFTPGTYLPKIEADAVMLDQVLLNLAVNAREAMPEGGRLTIGTSLRTIAPAQYPLPPDARPGNFVCLSLADTGCGMSESTKQRIFEPFFTTKEIGRGSGLGLPTILGIAKQHRGWIEVDSAPGAGSTFRVYFPIAAAKPEVAPPVSAPSAHDRAPASSRAASRASAPPPSATADTATGAPLATVLVVEDEALVRRTVALNLRRLGFRVLEAPQARDALEIWDAEGDGIDLLFTDMVMPGGISGLDLARRLRRVRPDLRVIISSGYSHALAEAGVPAGDASIIYLPKPFEITTLNELITRSLHEPASRT